MRARTGEVAEGTKGRIVEAALRTLREEGFAGCSARAIARAGGFNQALIFYHFGTLKELLLAALDRTAEERMARYGPAVEEARTLEDMVSVATEIYREDLEAGHITVLSEMIAGSLAHPELGPEIVARMEPWIDFAERAIARVLDRSPFAGVIPARTLAFAVVALYLGIDLLSYLDRDRPRAEAMFEAAARLAPVLAPLLGGDR